MKIKPVKRAVMYPKPEDDRKTFWATAGGYAKIENNT